MLFLCATVAHGGPLSDAERKQDPRLEKSVTLLSPRVYYLGELLEEVSRQTGVTLQAGDKDKASGELIVVRVQNLPLADVMNALWSLVSYKQATWDWTVISAKAPAGGTGQKVTYQLMRPREAQLFGAKLRQQTQDGFEAQARSSLDNLDKMAEELKDLEQKGEKEKYRVSRRTYEALGAFAELAPSQSDQLRALRGQDAVQVPISALGEKAKSYVDAETALRRELNPGLNIQKPTQVKLVREQLSGKLTSSLVIYMGDGNSMQGTTCVGGTAFEKQWRETVQAEWLLDGDKAEDAALENKITTPRQGTGRVRLSGTALRLWQCAEGASIPFIACLADSSIGDQGSSSSKTVRAALVKLSPLQSKWRNGVLLVRDPTWFVRETEEGRLSWSAVKKLRSSEASAADGLLPVSTLAESARDLSPEQLQNLTGEFPVMSQVARWHNWFVQMSHTPDLIERLQSAKGVPIQIMRVLSTVVLPANTSADQVRAVRMRVEDTARKDQKPASRTIVFELLGTNSTVLGSSGFFYEERELPAGTSPAASWFNANRLP